jgi:uncharacterized cupin superfamily protein
MRAYNYLAAETTLDPGDPEGFRSPYGLFNEIIGAEHLSGTLFDVPPGEKSCPYHWEAAKEEWLLVISGTPTIRHPAGETELRPGDLTCFSTGASGAHQLLNRSDAPARVVMFSNTADPNVIVYVDSGKVGVRGALGLPGGANYAIDNTLDYWEGEA